MPVLLDLDGDDRLDAGNLGIPAVSFLGVPKPTRGSRCHAAVRCLRPPLPLFHMRYTKSRRQAILAGSIALKK